MNNAVGVNYAAMLPAGVTISAAMPGGFRTFGFLPSGQLDKYLAVKFKTAGPATRFGWLHVVSTTPAFPTTSVTLDKWGYENTGASIQTRSDCLTTRKLNLSDGRAKLYWANANEDGVARYEVQAKDPSGAWHEVDSIASGENRYEATVVKGATCRLVVEMVDGIVSYTAF